MRKYGVRLARVEEYCEDPRLVAQALRGMYRTAARSGFSVQDPHTVMVTRTEYGYEYRMVWRKP